MGCLLVDTPTGRAFVCRIRTDDEIAESLAMTENEAHADEDAERLAWEADQLLAESRAEAEMSATDRARLQLLVGLGYLDVDLAEEAEADFDDHGLDEDGLPAAEHEPWSWPLGMSIIPVGQAVPGMCGFVGDLHAELFGEPQAAEDGNREP